MLHAHVSEQPRENTDCLAAHGCTPVELLARHAGLDERFCAVHATHVTSGDVGLLAAAGAVCCICPTTERDLADGIGPTAVLGEGRLCLGSDSHAVIDPFEEARAVELDERLASGRRGTHDPSALLRAATVEGYRALGWDGGTIAAGSVADFVTVGLDGVRLAGHDRTDPATSVVFAATAGDVRQVVVGGEHVVRDGVHRAIDVAAELDRSVTDAWRATLSTTIVDRIGRLTTNDETLGSGRGGVLDDAWLVIDDGRVAAVGRGSSPAADSRIDAAGRAVIPGFVDSHTHLVFAGDRADEFAARMAGEPYTAGGIASTVAATRAAGREALDATVLRLTDEARRSGTTTLEIKSGYGLTVEHELESLVVARAATPETTLLGAHVVPPEFAGRADDYVSLVCDEMVPACASHARWIDAFCERGAFDADQCRAVLEAGRAAGLGLRLHANQLSAGPGVRLAVELGCASADHCTFLSDADVDALAGGSTVATFLPATEFSTRQPYPDARRVIDAGVVVAIASNCNPGSSFTTSLPFCVALAVREMGMTVDEAVWAATAGGAAALRRDDVGTLTPGSRADLCILDAPSPVHFVYRPGVNVIASVLVGGRPLASPA